MPNFRPDIKPPMWGPPDAVRFAVMANAERLGIDPRSLFRVIPTWEGAGNDVDDILSGGWRSISGTAPWENHGLRVSRSNGGHITYPNDTWFYNGPWQDGFTVLSGHSIWSTAASEQYIWNRGNLISATRNPIALYQSANGSNAVVGVQGSGGTRWLTATKSFSANRFRNVGARITPGKIVTAIAEDVFADADYSADTFGGTTGDFEYIYNRFDGNRRPNLHSGYLYTFKAALTNDQIRQIFATPYALLMPVSRPVYFDLGATSEATLSEPSRGSLILTGKAAAVSFSGAVTAATQRGTLALTGKAPTVSLSGAVAVTTQRGALALTGKAPTVAFSGSVVAQTQRGNLTLTGKAPSVFVDIGTLSVLPAVGALTLAGKAPSVSLSGAVAVATQRGQLLLSGRSASVSIAGAISVATQRGSLLWSGRAPSLSYSGLVQAQTQRGNLTWTGLAPTILLAEAFTGEIKFMDEARPRPRRLQ